MCTLLECSYHFCNQVVFSLILTQCESEISALGHCDCGTCRSQALRYAVVGG